MTSVVPLQRQAAAPPHSIEAEQALLGAVMLSAEAFDLVASTTVTADFYDPMHGRIWDMVAQARSEGRAVTAALIRAQLGEDAALELQPGRTVGWYIAQLMQEAVTIFMAPDYARTVRHLADCRRIMAVCAEASTKAAAGLASNAAEIASGAISGLDEVVTSTVPDSARAISLSEATGAALRRCEDIADRKIRPHEISWGLRSLDARTNGLEIGDLVIVGGRPSMGKTTFGLSVALDMAKAGTGTYFVSLEMTAQQLGQRALAWRSFGRSTVPIQYLDIRSGNVRGEQREVLRGAHEFMDGLPIRIEQQGGLTIGQIAARARRHKQAMERSGRPMKVMVVDHLGIIRPSDRYKGNRVQEVTEFTGALKALAKELEIAVIALCQLSRQNESHDDKRPTQSAFRDSGSIEQDADMLIGLYREAYYLDKQTNLTPEQQELLMATQNVMEAILLKQRQGPTGPVRLYCAMPCNVVGDLQQ